VVNGTLELVLVSGYPGIGKSAATNELHKVLVLLRGRFACGCHGTASTVRPCWLRIDLHSSCHASHEAHAVRYLIDMRMRTGTRCASRTQVKIGFTEASPV
jgi:hypothetical protein